MAHNAWRSFADLSLNLATGELRRNGTPVPLERQPALVLVRLVSEAGQLVTRDSLRRAVWPDDTHVDYDRGLNYCLRQLRIALGDDARTPRFIETIPRQGYRFIADVASEPSIEPIAAIPTNRRRTVVVAALAATLVILTVIVERGPGHERHHEAAVAVVRTVHDWLF